MNKTKKLLNTKICKCNAKIIVIEEYNEVRGFFSEFDSIEDYLEKKDIDQEELMPIKTTKMKCTKCGQIFLGLRGKHYE